MRRGTIKGGMQTAGVKPLYCRCGKSTSKILRFSDGTEISIHFTKKSTYWHIFKNGNIKRTFKMPKQWT